MSTRRIFIFWIHPLFHESVRLLLNHPQIEWVGSSSDYENGWDPMMQNLPDTVLVEEIGGGIPAGFMERLDYCPWNIRIVGLNIQDNQACIYHRVQRDIGKAEDLLHWILYDPS